MRILARPAALRAVAHRAKARGETIGFVPTMGALHEGHLSLLRRARGAHDRVVVSIFVNPLQFGPREDYTRYPRNEVRDVRLCRDGGCDWLFLPRAKALYPAGFETHIVPGSLAARWEGAARPGHFTGVATVVLKLLHLVEPDTLYLGQKDVQQARVVGAMIRDLDLPVRLAVAPTVRERDGLAMSSRNSFLEPPERGRAAGIIRALRAGREAARSGVREARAIVAAARKVLAREARPDSIDYLALVDRADLSPLVRLDRPALLLVAAVIGGTRLIDNLEVAPPRGGRQGVR